MDLDDCFTDEEDPFGMPYESSHTEVLVNQITRRAIWTPGGNTTYSIEVFFTAHDAKNYSMMVVSGTITLRYVPVDDSPRYLGKLVDARLKYGEEWNVTLEDQFFDEDTAALKFSVNNAAVKITELDKTRHIATWKPRKGDTNQTNVIFTAYDGTTRTASAPIKLSYDAPPEPQTVSQIINVMQSIPWFVYVLLPVGIFGGIMAYYSYRRVKYGHYEIEQLFLIYNDGRLLAHRQKRDRPQVSNDILTGMLTALKGFIQESLQDQNKGQLDEMKYGNLKIALEHGKTVYLAAFISGYVTDKLKSEMKDVVGKVEAAYEPVLRSWDGMMASVEGSGALLDELIGKPGR
jgi:hypothetical protein